MQVIGMLLVMTGGVMLSVVGFSLFTWQYWAIATPLIIGTMLMECGK